ncbi:MAG: hypothetical protein KDC35_01235 [Acidobacteria bacterium]|nr:hypothetical protein [Acidobacteriota bacterium]
MTTHFEWLLWLIKSITMMLDFWLCLAVATGVWTRFRVWWLPLAGLLTGLQLMLQVALGMWHQEQAHLAWLIWWLVFGSHVAVTAVLLRAMTWGVPPIRR